MRNLFYETLQDNISNDQQEFRWILEFFFQKPYSFLLTQKEVCFSEREYEKYLKILQLRKEHYPLQYIFKIQEFWGYEFECQEGVLIPRKETECLVDYILQQGKKSANILEVGVGSGVISISLKKERKDFNVQGVDINPFALKLAYRNAKKILEKDQIPFFYESDCFSQVKGQFDIIVSNPPYLNKKELLTTDPELLFEPEEALVAKNNGLDFYEKIVYQGESFLKKDSLLVLEISERRIEEIKEIFIKKNYIFENLLIDFLGNKRGLVFKKEF